MPNNRKQKQDKATADEAFRTVGLHAARKRFEQMTPAKMVALQKHLNTISKKGVEARKQKKKDRTV